MKDQRFPFALDLGTEIGGYKIDKVLGAGGFGITYRGYNDITQKYVAIKEFYVRDISTRDGQTVVVDTEVDEGTYEYALRKFQEEAQAVVTRFSHSYIIRGENFLRLHNTCYMIMEYVDGSNLDDWLQARKSPPSEREIRPFFEKLFDAVDYVHGQNTMHRDLTPRNIMVRGNGDPVLIDFGAAGLGIDLGRSSKIVAQLRYAPPEQTDDTGSGVHGRYTDVFSLGGVLFRTVTGKTPTAPMTRLNRMSAHRGDGADPQQPVAELVADPTQFTPQFLAGIDHALRLDERQRPQSISELRQTLGWGERASQRPAPAPPAEIPPGDDVTQLVSAPPPLPLPLQPLQPSGFSNSQTPRSGFTSPPPPRASISAPQPRRPEAPSRVTGPASQPGPQPIEPKRRGRGRLVAILLVAGAFGGGAWLAVPQVAGLIDQASGPVMVSPYTFNASLDGTSVTLSGYALSPENRSAIADAVRRSQPAAIIDNRLRLAKGASADFDTLAREIAGHLGKFSHVTVAIVDGSATIEGAAANPGVYQELQTSLNSIVARAGKGSVKLDPATVLPYPFAIDVTSGSVALSGYLPSDSIRDAIRAAIAAAMPARRIDDRTRIALGSPLDLASLVPALVPRLANLATGRLAISGGSVRIEGTPATPALYETVSTLDQAMVPGSVPVELAIQLPSVSPYTWSLTTDGQSIVARGYVPGAADRRPIADAVAASQPDVPFKDETAVAAGAPTDFTAAATLLADQLKHFKRGRLAITGDTVAIEGVPKTPADLPQIESSIRSGLPTGLKLGQTSIEAPKVSPYEFTAEVADGVLRLSGYVPSEAARSEVKAQALGALRLADDLQIADGAPDNFTAGARFAIGQAQLLANGSAKFKDTRIAVEGTVRTLDDLVALRAQARSAVPGGLTLDRPQYRTRTDVGVQDCDRLALPVDQPDRPAGESGVDFAALDAARAVPACRQAVTDYPNVRRFATALGFALQKNKQFAEAATQYRRAVEALDASAMSQLAGMLRDGLGMPQDYATSFDLFNRAAQAGSAQATFAIGGFFENGLGRTRDLAKASEWYQKAAALNVGDAYAQLGVLAQTGAIRGLPDYPRAIDAFERGAKLGSTLAMQHLGNIYQQGLTPSRIPDLAQAFKWYLKAADLGRPESMTAAGTFYLEGIGREPDYAKAALWLEKAAAAGDASAYLQLGRIAAEGLGRPKDPAGAIALYEKAAAAGQTQSYARIALLYQTGGGPNGRPDYAQAYDWNLKGTKANDPEAYYQLAGLYEHGLGRPVDFAKAVDNYQHAGDLGHAQSLFQLGTLAESGRGKPVDFARAVAFYKRAGELGHAQALVQFGLLSETGSGTPKDDVAALNSFTQAAASGNGAALWNAALLTDAGRGGSKNPERAALYLLRAIAAHDPRAVEAASGDLAAFTVETRTALQRVLQTRGLLQRPNPDGVYDAETRKAALAWSPTVTN